MRQLYWNNIRCISRSTQTQQQIPWKAVTWKIVTLAASMQ